jgi:hypothetical protein
VVRLVKDRTTASNCPVHLKDRLCNRTGKNQLNRAVFYETAKPGGSTRTGAVLYIDNFTPLSIQHNLIRLGVKSEMVCISHIEGYIHTFSEQAREKLRWRRRGTSEAWRGTNKQGCGGRPPALRHQRADPVPVLRRLEAATAPRHSSGRPASARPCRPGSLVPC